MHGERIGRFFSIIVGIFLLIFGLALSIGGIVFLICSPITPSGVAEAVFTTMLAPLGVYVFHMTLSKYVLNDPYHYVDSYSGSVSDGGHVSLRRDSEPDETPRYLFRKMVFGFIESGMSVLVAVICILKAIIVKMHIAGLIIEAIVNIVIAIISFLVLGIDTKNKLKNINIEIL